VNTLRHTQLLLALEDADVEQLLQLLVTVVDTQLLKPIAVEYLEAEDIQNTNRFCDGR
jgi:hypothetical protein